MKRALLFAATLLIATGLTACGPKKQPGTPIAAPSPFPDPRPATQPPPPPPKDTAPPPTAVPVDQPVTAGDPLERAAIVDINKDSPLKPVFFAYDSDSLDEDARKTMAENAQVLKKYSTWVITIEGHCDERGTAEYNLALGDRRAIATKNYLVTLGIPAERMKTVSYGNEFPFDPGHDETAWKANRRAHFMLTSK